MLNRIIYISFFFFHDHVVSYDHVEQLNSTNSIYVDLPRSVPLFYFHRLLFLKYD